MTDRETPAVVRHAPVGILKLSGDGEVLSANDAAADVLETDPADLVGASVDAALPRSAAGTLREAVGGDPSAASFEEYYPTIDRWLDVQVTPTDGATLVYLRDRTERRADAQTAKRLRRRLDRVQSIDAVTTSVVRSLVDSSDHREVARVVCEGLGTTELYAFAWVGERDPTDGDLRVLAAAGDAPELRDSIESALEGARGLPEQRAVATGETQAAPSLAADEDLPAAVRRTAFGSGLQSSVAVPVAYRDTVYGSIGVYSAREEGISDQERASLETLGAMAGFAITASRRERLLFADTVTELAVEVGDATPLVAVARERTCRLSLGGIVPREDGSVLYYLTVDDGDGDGDADTGAGGDTGPDGHVGADADDRVDPAGRVDGVVGALSTHDDVAGARSVGESGDPIEVRVDGATPASVLSARGATVRTGEYAATGARVVADLSPEDDPRRVLEALDRQFEDVTVVSKAERQRSPETATFEDDLADALTDRQRTALRTAYLSEYFRSPRESTAEEVADALDITAPTLSYHLRAAQRKLAAAFFGDDPAR